MKQNYGRETGRKRKKEGIIDGTSIETIVENAPSFFRRKIKIRTYVWFVTERAEK